MNAADAQWQPSRLATPPARLLIADDHELARSGLRAMLDGEQDLQVVAEAVDGIDALALCHSTAPDLALLDLRMPRLDGLACASRIGVELPAIKVVIVTMHDGLQHMEQALQAGASGYVLKDASRLDLLSAVRSVLRGQPYLHGVLSARLMQQRMVASRQGATSGEPLTSRETEVLALVAQGLTNKEIGRRLDIAPGTAKIHVEHLIAKLGVSDRTQAAVHAVSTGLIGRTSP